MPVKYSNFLEVSPSFESVVDIDADKRNVNLWREYIVGDDMDKLVECLCESLGNEAVESRRSFWIHGSYGTGKSYAAIFVKHLMEDNASAVDSFLANSNRLSKYRNRFAKCRKNGDYLVIWKAGCTGIRTGDMLLLEMEKAISDALVEKYGDDAYLGSGSLIGAVRNRLADPSINWDYLLETTVLGDDATSVEELREKVDSGDLSAIKATAEVIRQKGYGLVNNLETFKAWISDIIDGNGLSKSGIFFIWDEFTEYVSYSDDHTVMQQISEFCKEKPFFMLYVVHRSQEMLDSMGKDRYQMIIHRFHEVEFHVSTDAAFDLISGSINTRNGMDQIWLGEKKRVVNRIKPFLPDMAGLDDKISEMVGLYCPIHPMTIRLLSRVAESFAAAQRTMFRFMKDQSNSELGFVGYINKHGPDDQACWLTPDWLWDYFFTRDSDFSDKDTKAAEYIHHYEDSLHLVENDENALRVFKVAMLLLAVMSTTKGVYGGKKLHGGISATEECLINCLAGVMTKAQVKDLLATLEECKVLLRDEAANGLVRLQLPFKGGSGDDFKARYEQNDKKYTRYQMFSKDGVFANELEDKAWDENDASKRRMKICVCCAETLSIKNRLEEINSELQKAPYKLGLLIVIVRDDAQYMSIQSQLAGLAADSGEPRLTIALAKTPLTDELRKKWLTSLTKQEMASISSNASATANQHRQEAMTTIATWVSEVAGGSKILAWNCDRAFMSNIYGFTNLRKVINTNVLQELFPYAPENIVVTNTAYKPCNDSAPLAGITRDSGNSQVKNVLNVLKQAGLLELTTMDSMVNASGSKAAKAISELAKMIQEEMQSGQKVVLSELWERLQTRPFGYYNTIACGVLLGYVFSCYKDSAFSWTDNAQSTHVLGETTLKTMILQMCKGAMTTDYLSAGSVTFQNFRQYMQSIFGLSDAQIANETECWHNIREAVTRAGTPFWTLKYLPDEVYGSVNSKNAVKQIVDNIQLYIAQDSKRETVMSNVIQLFNGQGKQRKAMAKAFQDKNTMNAAFRTFLFEASPELRDIAVKLSIKPEELGDRLLVAMQSAIYTWTEAQVKDKLPNVVSEYSFLEALNSALGKVYHSTEDARRDLANLFKFQRIPMAALEKLNKPWYGALLVMYNVSRNGAALMTLEERSASVAELNRYGKAAMDCLKDGRPALSDILEARNLDCTPQELDSIYSGLKDINCDSLNATFEKELQSQISRISQARNRIILQERWRSLTGEDSAKSWCTSHGAPLLWVVGKGNIKALSTLIDVQRNYRTIDQDVQNAIAALDSMDTAILNDNEKITRALIETVGTEYGPILEENRAEVLAQAKMKIGNDMSLWEITDLVVFQGILKKALQDSAKKKKYEQAKLTVSKMDGEELRRRVVDFINSHPEYCDDFTKSGG